MGRVAFGTRVPAHCRPPHLAAQSWVLQPYICDQITVTCKLASRPILC